MNGSMPHDIARCNGAGRAECADCLRRTAPPGQWQAYIPPQSGPCAFRIGAKNERTATGGVAGGRAG